MIKTKLFITLLCVAMCVVGVHAATITGHVVDKATGKHIPYLTIAIKGSTYGTYSDESGHFRIDNVKSGKYTIEV